MIGGGKLVGLLSTLTRGAAIAPSECLGSRPYEELPEVWESSEHRQRLVDAGLAVPVEIDDLNLARFTFYSLQQNCTTLEVTWLLTYRCNLRCVYCTQAGLPQTVKRGELTKEVIDKVAVWLKRMVRARNSRELSLMLFGGEPLVCSRRDIRFVIDRVYESCSGLCEVTVGMTTNGTLLDPSTTDCLVESGCNFFQITLDGARESHDARRYDGKGKGSYDVILRNLEYVASRSDVLVQVNLDSDVAKTMPQLYEDLRKIGVLHKVEFNFGGVLPNRVGHKGSGADSGVLEGQEPEQEALLLGLKVRQHLLSGPCPFRSRRCPIIDPIGDFYSCFSAVGDSKYRLGNVDDGVLLELYYASHLGADSWLRDECQVCEFLPACWGGCAYQASLNSNDIRFKCEQRIMRNRTKSIVRYHVARLALEKRFDQGFTSWSARLIPNKGGEINAIDGR